MEAVGRLTGGIAHDFNNLLTAIIGNVDLAQRRFTTDPERARRSIGNVKEAALRAAALVQRLLTFSRQHPQEVAIVDVNRVVRDMSELLQRTLGETITIEAVLAAGLWKASLDQNQLENAIINIAVNARDAMPDGGRLTIESGNIYLDENYVADEGDDDLKAGQFVMLAMSDTGTGMTREVISRAFEPFFTTKPQGAGTGLGLSMVYGFVKQSGGHIKIYSERREGTTVKMYFPRAIEQVVATTPARAVTAVDKIAVAAPNSLETILLVEDDEKVNQFGSEILTELGYTVLSARDGQHALEIVAEYRGINLLFTDVVLPGGMNGRQLADEARKLIPNLTVLYTTGYTRNAIVHHGRLDPGVDVLMKPYTFDALARKVRQVLDAAAEPQQPVG
jgi:two-component system NtrC family sensor kinase